MNDWLLDKWPFISPVLAWLGAWCVALSSRQTRLDIWHEKWLALFMLPLTLLMAVIGFIIIGGFFALLLFNAPHVSGDWILPVLLLAGYPLTAWYMAYTVIYQ